MNEQSWTTVETNPSDELHLEIIRAIKEHLANSEAAIFASSDRRYSHSIAIENTLYSVRYNYNAATSSITNLEFRNAEA